jgi:uncharacterized membrane-anchored protein
MRLMWRMQGWKVVAFSLAYTTWNIANDFIRKFGDLSFHKSALVTSMVLAPAGLWLIKDNFLNAFWFSSAILGFAMCI